MLGGGECSLYCRCLINHLIYRTGDYDGDKVIVIWQPEIVSRFKNPDDSYATPPPGLEDSFIKNTETVQQFMQRVPQEIDPERHQLELQKFLLGALRDQSVFGTYSSMHDNAVYKYGYFHKEAKRLAYMYVLDI